MQDKHLEDSGAWVEGGDTPLPKSPGSALSLREAFKVWRFGVCWSLVLSMAVIMESYDTILLNSLYANPIFQRDYGVRQPSGKYIIPTKWQSALGSGTQAALIVGIFLGAPLIDKFGSRKCMIGGLVWNFAFGFLIFFSKDLRYLLAGNLLCGLPWGLFSVCAVAYAVEVVPGQLRNYLASYVNLCWVAGHLVASIVLKATLSYGTAWTYKLPFLLILVPPIPLALALYFAPESPYYLARKDRLEEATAAMDRLHAAHPSVNSRELVEQIAETNRLESEMRTGGTWAACFSGVNRRRTEIAIVAWTSPALVGFAFQFYGTFFFTRAGFAPSEAFALGLGNYAIAFGGTIFSWILQTYCGRRTIILYGYCFMLPITTLIACLDFAKSNAAHWAQASFFMVYFFAYGSSQGPVPYVIASEASANKLRAKTLALARIVYYCASIISQVLAPWMFQTWNLKGKTAFPAAGMTFLLLIWAFFRLPEMKGRSFEELDILFALKTPTRKFSSHVITEADKADVGHVEQQAMAKH
ncbi:hypothetical protein JCM8202v2_004680 [Rhodotorula sphaerocarpa]